MIFCKANIGTNHVVQQLLDTYGRALGQQVNTNKTTMVFSKTITGDIREEMRAFWANGIV